MVMTGFLPTHSIETPLADEVIERKFAAMMDGVKKGSLTNQVMTAAMVLVPHFYTDDEFLKCLMVANDVSPGSSARDLLAANTDFVDTLFENTPPSAFNTFDPEELRARILLGAQNKVNPRGTIYTRDGRSLRGDYATVSATLSGFIAWIHSRVQALFDSFSDEGLMRTTIECQNFDVPTDVNLLIRVETYANSSYDVEVEWFGRRVISRDPTAFVMALTIAMAGAIT